MRREVRVLLLSEANWGLTGVGKRGNMSIEHCSSKPGTFRVFPDITIYSMLWSKGHSGRFVPVRTAVFPEGVQTAVAFCFNPNLGKEHCK